MRPWMRWLAALALAAGCAPLALPADEEPKTRMGPRGDSPRIAALKAAVGAGNAAALNEFWKEIKAISPSSVIWYHSDGNILDVIEDLVQAGLDILNPLQPECLNVEEVHRRWGRRLTLDGCLGTQSTMPFGTPAAVRARVKEVIDKFGRQGGLILSPTHVLEPEVPLANIDAFAAACRDYGTFRKD